MSPGSVQTHEPPSAMAGVGRRALGRIWLFFLSAVLLCFAIDAALFRTPFYAAHLQPESSAGVFESALQAERQRPVEPGREALVMGDSRVAEGFSAKLANQLQKETGVRFGSGAVAASTPRDWYYFLRDLDPAGRRYRAIVFAMDDYSDQNREDWAGMPTDLHIVIARLRISDIGDFALSYDTLQGRMRALLGSTFKGLTYKQDVQQFLSNVNRRMKQAELYRLHSASWRYDYGGNAGTLAGLTIDWRTGSMARPGGLTEGQKTTIRRNLFPRPCPEPCDNAAFRRLWLGRILDRYRATGTRIVFLRLPYGPYPRQGVLPLNGTGFVERAVQAGRAEMLDPLFFAPLERPELFFDGFHLNREGRQRFTTMLATEIGRRLK